MYQPKIWLKFYTNKDASHRVSKVIKLEKQDCQEEWYKSILDHVFQYGCDVQIPEIERDTTSNTSHPKPEVATQFSVH